MEGRLSGREEGEVGKEKTREILELGNDLMSGHVLYLHRCTIWNSFGP